MHSNDKQNAPSISSNTNATKPKPLKWLPRPELQSWYIYATPGRLMMDGRVANLDSVISNSSLMPKKMESDDWEPEALRRFAVKQPHLAREAGVSVTSLATTLVDKDGKAVEREDDRRSVASAIEEDVEREGQEGWETEAETDRYGWEEEHMSMMSSRDSMDGEMGRRSVDSDAASERTIRGANIRPGEIGVGGVEIPRAPPRDWKEQRERDNEGKKRGLIWKVLSMNAR